MIAYKTYSQCSSNVPTNIPLVCPWQVQECNETEVQNLQKQGFAVVTQEEYDSYLLAIKPEMDVWELTRYQDDAIKSISQSILTPAIEFANRCILEFASENIMLGITQAGMTSVVSEYTRDLILALNTGSLYDAIKRAREIPPEHKDPKFLTDTRLLLFINKIEQYLNIPISEAL